jgi:hypothetical protein
MKVEDVMEKDFNELTVKHGGKFADLPFKEWRSCDFIEDDYYIDTYADSMRYAFVKRIFCSDASGYNFKEVKTLNIKQRSVNDYGTRVLFLLGLVYNDNSVAYVRKSLESVLSEFEDMLTSFPFNKEEYTQQDLYYDGVYGGQNLDGFYRVVFPYGITVDYECTDNRISRTSCDSGKRIKNIHVELFDKRSLNGLNRLNKYMQTGIAAGNLLHLFDDISFVLSEVVFRDHRAYNRLVQLRYKDSFGERVLSSQDTVIINLSSFTFIDELDASFASKIYLDSNAVHSFFDSANSRKTIILPLNLKRIDSGALSTEGYSEDGIFIHDVVKYISDDAFLGTSCKLYMKREVYDKIKKNPECSKFDEYPNTNVKVEFKEVLDCQFSDYLA